jgi:glycine/D-amino acid oxidase-like deaminating enzyme
MYDAIVIGARCAGSPTAMLLARRGYRVLLVDRSTFPSDTLSTTLHPAVRRRPAATLGTRGADRGDELPTDAATAV